MNLYGPEHTTRYVIEYLDGDDWCIEEIAWSESDAHSAKAFLRQCGHPEENIRIIEETI